MTVHCRIFIPNNFCENALFSIYTITPRDEAKNPVIKVRNGELFFLFLNQNICCGYPKVPSQWDGSFEHPKHVFKLMDKKINSILLSKISVLPWSLVIKLKSIFKSPTTPAPQRTWTEMDGITSRNLLYCPKLFRFVQKRGRRLVKSGQ